MELPPERCRASALSRKGRLQTQPRSRKDRTGPWPPEGAVPSVCSGAPRGLEGRSESRVPPRCFPFSKRIQMQSDSSRGWLIMRKIGPPQAPAAAGPAAYSPRLGPTRVPCLPTPTPPSQGEGWCLSASPCGRRCSPAPPRCRHDPDPTALSLGHIGTRRTWAGLATRSQPRVRSCNRAPHGTLLLSLCASFSGYSAAPAPRQAVALSLCVQTLNSVCFPQKHHSWAPPSLSCNPSAWPCCPGMSPPFWGPPPSPPRRPEPVSSSLFHSLTWAGAPSGTFLGKEATCLSGDVCPVPPPHCKGGVFTARALASTPSSLHTCSGSTRRSRRQRLSRS